MIKTNVGNTQLEGNIPIFLADIGSICGSVKEVLMEKGFSEESADKVIKEFVELETGRCWSFYVAQLYVYLSAYQ